MNIPSTPLGFWDFLGIYRAKRRFGGHPRWAQPTRARLVLHSEHPSGASLAHWISSGPKKSTKSFTAFGLRLILITCNVKNMQKQQLALGTMSIG